MSNNASGQIQESWSGPETMVGGITERLRKAIITGAIRPRERMRVADLERKFGVSHIPIREAPRRLQSEGFVEISPRRTTIAAGVDLSDLANIYDLRRIIEVEIGRRSVSLPLFVSTFATIDTVIDLHVELYEALQEGRYHLSERAHSALGGNGKDRSGWIQFASE
jgi:DNA-binding GntR family transcriptional regulator